METNPSSSSSSSSSSPPAKKLKMETNPSSSSSSSSSPPAKKFDVFLSFRGEDTRNNFTGHLSLALRKMGLVFNIFKDDYALEKGKEIGPELLNAIEDSRYAVVVLSKNYADSHWCLKELAKIVECMGDSGRIRTIFYHVDPSDVRNHKGSFGEALQEHEKDPRHSSEEVQSWRKALTKVANQSGETVDSQTEEAIFIEKFVSNISSELGASLRSMDGLFGMSSRLEKLNSCVDESFATNKVCLIGIHGMGGIGKSTLATAYYKQMSHKFEGSCFLENVREFCEKKPNGLVDLQKQLLSKNLKDNFEEIDCVNDGVDMIRSRLRSKRVLIVLDDVNEEDQLNGLAGEDNWFGSESIIIVTTREHSFLTKRKYKIYEAECLNRSESLQLFSSKAFGSIEPTKEYEKLSEQVIKYASCLPLALTVLGSLLGGKCQSEWESALGRLRNCPEKGIVEKLKISFDDLNEIDQRIFLDIACFFNGYSEDNVKEILDSCGFHPIIGIRNLMNKSLLSNEFGRLRMHDLLEEMGKEIVRKESRNNLGRQSRIWDENDLYRVLENEEGTNEVEAIVAFPDEETMEFKFEETMEFKFEALSSMKNLRLLLLKFYSCTKCDVPKLKYLSNNLQYLQWSGSNIEQLWNNCVKPLYNLKVIDLAGSKHFTKFEDFRVVPNLEKLILWGCVKLSEIHPSIKHLKKLILLNLHGCISLERLPEEINGLASLQTLNLSDCSKLLEIHPSIKHLKKLILLDLHGCKSLERLPEEINGLASLQTLNLSDCSKLLEIHPSIKHLKKLILLDLHGCKSLERLPEEINGLTSLQTLNLSDCSKLLEIHPSIKHLKKLILLDLHGCTSLERLPEEINGRASLQTLNLFGCSNLLEIHPSIEHLKKLIRLDLRRCTSLKRLPEEINGLASLQTLNLSHCYQLLEIHPSIKHLKKLILLDLERCTSLERLPEEINGLASLQTLNLFGCSKLLEIHPSIEHLKKLIRLDLERCTSLKRLPEEINGLASLQTLNLFGCSNLLEIHPSIEHLKKLIRLDLERCTSLKRLPEEINGLASLQTLNLSHCYQLLEIHPSIKHLKKLILLDLKWCTSIERLPEEINGLASLQTLNLQSCYKLKKLPDSLAQLKSLRKLDIEDSGIKHLPSSINLMEMLESLNFDIRGIIKSGIREGIWSYGTTGKCFLPGWFSTEPESPYLLLLTELNLRRCNLSGPEAFPEYFGKLVHLKSLDLSENPLSLLPPEIKGLTRLEILELSHCRSLRCLEAELLPSSLQKVRVIGCISLASFLDPSKPCHLRCLSKISCVNCTELVKRQDAKMTALASLSRFLQNFSKRRDDDPRFEFIIPERDNELPSWFFNQSRTGSITIKFDPNRRNSELIGLALAFCLPAHSATDHKCVFNIRVNGSENGKINLDLDVTFFNRAHLFLLCYPKSDDVFLKWEGIPGLGNMLEPASWDTLEFSFSYHHHRKKFTRKEFTLDQWDDDEFSSGSWDDDWPGGTCGARLVYEEDIEELKQITPYYNDQKDVQSSHSQSISQLSKLRHIGSLGPQQLTGLRGILDLEDDLEMQQYADEEGPNNPESNPSMVGNTHFGVFRNYTGIATKLLDNLKGERESE